MAQTVFGAEYVVTVLNRAFNNASPANLVFKNQVATAGAAEATQLQFAANFGKNFINTSDAALATQVLTNLGVLPSTVAEVQALEAALADFFGTVSKEDRGIVVLQLGAILSGLETAEGELAVYADAAKAWNKEVEQSYTYSADPASTTPFEGDFAPVDTGTFKLTHSTDTATANKFVADLVYTPGGDDRINSLQDEDTLTGTGDNPTLTATLGNANDNGDTIITPALNGIETLNVGFTGSGAFAVEALDLQDATGLKALNISRVSQTSNRAEVGNLQNPLDSIRIANTNANQGGVVEVSFAAGVLRGDNTASVELSNVSIGALNLGQNTSGIGANGVGTNGFETINLTSTGSANTIGNFNVPADTGTDGAINITGDQSLTIATSGAIVSATNGLAEAQLFGGGINGNAGRLKTVDASALEGALKLNIGNGILSTGKADTSGVKQDVTIIGSKSDDTFYLNDVVEAGDTIDGSEGNDTLVVFGGGVAGTVKSVEQASVTAQDDVTLDFDKLADTSLISIRNISNNGAGTSADGNRTIKLDNLTAAQATGLKVHHGVSLNNGADDLKVIANLKNAAGTNDTVAVSIEDGFNADPRFSFQLEAAKVENITLGDNDTESNVVVLNKFADHTGKITITGGQAGKFLSLDADTALADAIIGGDVVGVNTGLYGHNITDVAEVGPIVAPDVEELKGDILELSGLATQVRIGAAEVDASAAASDIIVRLGTNAADIDGAQKVTTGSGNDTVIFDLVNDATAGLTIADVVDAGAGDDTLVIDGQDVLIDIQASEWTNVKGFETLRLVGNGTLPISNKYGENSYNLTLTDSFIAANNKNGVLAIVNDNHSANDAADKADAAWVGDLAVSSGVTIDATGLSANSHFSYNGEEGGLRTEDRFIVRDPVLAGKLAIDGGAVDNLSTTFGANTDVLEIRNAAQATAADLAGLKNIGIIAGVNDQAIVQTLSLQLTDTVVDALVDSFHAASVTEKETLTVRMNDAADIAGAVAGAALKLDARTLSSKFIVDVTLDNVTPVKDTFQVGNKGATLNVVNFNAAEDVISLSINALGLKGGASGSATADYVANQAVVVVNAAAAAILANWENQVVVDTDANIAGLDVSGVVNGPVLAYDTTNDFLLWDADGNFATGAVIVGSFAGAGALTAADFGNNFLA